MAGIILEVILLLLLPLEDLRLRQLLRKLLLLHYLPKQLPQKLTLHYLPKQLPHRLKFHLSQKLKLLNYKTKWIQMFVK